MNYLIVANWKMNPDTLGKAKKLFNSVKKGIKNIKNAEVVICPPFVSLSALCPFKSLLNDGYPISIIKLGAQNCFWENEGAFTGEISPKMLKDLGVKYIILGHSERRKYQRETDEMINKKIKTTLKEKLKAILCVENVSQVEKGLKDVEKKFFKNLILAYEPVFAIGTGRPCGIEKAKKMKLLIQKTLKQNTPIIYGGSVNSQNAADYIRKAGFQGLLIGGASLNPDEFIKIVKSTITNKD